MTQRYSSKRRTKNNGRTIRSLDKKIRSRDLADAKRVRSRMSKEKKNKLKNTPRISGRGNGNHRIFVGKAGYQRSTRGLLKVVKSSRGQKERFPLKHCDLCKKRGRAKKKSAFVPAFQKKGEQSEERGTN